MAPTCAVPWDREQNLLTHPQSLVKGCWRSQQRGRTRLSSCPGRAGGRMSHVSCSAWGAPSPAMSLPCAQGSAGTRPEAAHQDRDRGYLSEPGLTSPQPLPRRCRRAGYEGAAPRSLFIGRLSGACPTREPVRPQDWEGAGADWRGRCRRCGTPPRGRGSPPGMLRLARRSAASPRSEA